jgi:hypothetical protein
VTYLSITGTGKRAKETTNLGIAVSFDGSSKGAYKIVMQRTDGSEVTLTMLAVITKDGMNYIRGQSWNKMYEISGLKEIVEQMESGNEKS